MSPKLAHAHATVEALDHWLHDTPGQLPGTRGLMEDAQIALTYALDELAQSNDDRNTAIQLGVKLALRVAELEAEVAEAEHAELLADQRLDYLWDAR